MPVLARTATAALVIVAFVVAGCNRHVDPTQALHSQVAPFTQTRDHTVAMVTAAKHTLDPPSLNQLNVSYAALEAKGNEYAGFLVESVSIASFDAMRNDQDASSLKKAIDDFNASLGTISPKVAGTDRLSTAWVPDFASSVKTYWDRYHANVATATPQTRDALIKQLKSDTVWPNFEDIATQPLSAPPTHRP